MIFGGCLCGTVRYQTAASPLAAGLCWCRVCQYIAAGNATANICFPVGGLEITGTMTDYISTADSGNVMHRRFCPVCGTHLFTASEARPALLFARAGTLDDPEIMKPAATIWTASAPAWACIDKSIPKFDHQPPPIP
ncbi:GFA family protein [Acidocella sp.]|jgi:hypothetical protein|uniref:GFA family protein n=1 Tax=Acidocella sp. TaxID=50710 RepID=UPI002F4110BF